MKKLSTLLENYDSNPGNGIKLGVMNHLTPIGNIITNIRNFFGSVMGIIVEPGEDGVSLKLHSSRFINPQETDKILNTPYLGSTTLKQYICQQGLCNIKTINIGQYCIVYCGPNDIKTAEPIAKVVAKAKNDLKKDIATDKENPQPANICCTEMLQYNIQECEMDSLNEAIIDDEELEDKTKEQLLKFIKGTDKVKCAAKLAELLKDDIDLPESYYFKGVKDTDGNESIALRYSYDKRRPFGKTVKLTKSLLNIYKTGKDAVWVEAFLTQDKNSPEMNEIVKSVLKLIGAKPTSDPCVYEIDDDSIEDLENDINTKDAIEKSKEKEEESLDKKPQTSEISPSMKDDDENLKY